MAELNLHLANFLAQIFPKSQGITLAEILCIIKRVAVFLINISTVLAVIFVILAGISIAWPSVSPLKTQAAKRRLNTAVVGTFIILAVGVILNTITNAVHLGSPPSGSGPIIPGCDAQSLPLAAVNKVKDLFQQTSEPETFFSGDQPLAHVLPTEELQFFWVKDYLYFLGDVIATVNNKALTAGASSSHTP